MAYKAKFLHFKTKQSYNAERNKTSEGTDERKVFDAYISFIDEGPTICTWGKEYKCSIDEARINEILEEKGVGEKEAVIIDLTQYTPEQEFTSLELYNQLNDAIINDKIIISSIRMDSNITLFPMQYYEKNSGIITISTAACSNAIHTLVIQTLHIIALNTGTCIIHLNNVESGSSTPKVADGSGSIGTSLNYAREDHIHPAQTSVTGNAGTATKLETARNISLTGNVTGSASFDGSDNISINTTIGSIDASKITSGTLNADRLPDIPLEKLPAGALERLVIVENQAARYQLTTSDVQEGDTVKQEDTGLMYFVVDIDNLANENGYKVYTAGAATSVAWSGVTGKPNTLEGYGVSSTDAYLSKPTTFEWTNGTTAGPTGSLTGTNTNVSVPAIPAASEEQSGIVTTSAQTFQGDKTFIGNVTVDSVCNSYEVYSTYAHLSQIENQDGGTTPIYIGSGGEHSISYDGSEYTGNAATATKVNNKLTFTGAVTGEYDGSSALTVNIPEGGGDIPIALPNPYPLTLGNSSYDGREAVSINYLPNPYALTINGSTYDGSSAVTINTLYPLAEISYAASTVDIGYNTNSGIHAGYVYYPQSWTLFNTNRTIHVKCDKFNFNKPSTIIIIYGEGTVSFEYANGYLLKQNNIITTASSSNSYRLYCFSYLAGTGTNTRVAVNCSEYSA